MSYWRLKENIWISSEQQKDVSISFKNLHSGSWKKYRYFKMWKMLLIWKKTSEFDHHKGNYTTIAFCWFWQFDLKVHEMTTYLKENWLDIQRSARSSQHGKHASWCTRPNNCVNIVFYTAQIASGKKERLRWALKKTSRFGGGVFAFVLFFFKKPECIRKF